MGSNAKMAESRANFLGHPKNIAYLQDSQRQVAPFQGVAEGRSRKGRDTHWQRDLVQIIFLKILNQFFCLFQVSGGLFTDIIFTNIYSGFVVNQGLVADRHHFVW